MITDSGPWRGELLKTSARLEKKKSQRRWTEQSSFLVERDVMIGAYSVRKLLESHKVSNVLASRRLRVQRYSIIGKVPDALSRYEFWNHYDLDKPEEADIDVAQLCNQIIHSWIWGLSADYETNLFDGIYVCSDRARSKHLYFFSVDLLAGLFRDIGSEEIASVRTERDSKGEMRITEVEARRHSREA